ncbi:methyltransferase domain-containing protein [Candidatus Poseidoniales archaeon]|nr:methyltransferase domain-containing protein [Candidatus Poseidoniales archaeon]
MLGKVLPHQVEIIYKMLSNLPQGNEYKIVHLGFGNPLFEHINLKNWAYRIYDLQRQEYTDIRGNKPKRLIRKINVIFSDIWYKSTDIETVWKWNLLLRSEISNFGDSLFSDSCSGKQEFRTLDAANLELSNNSMDFVIAIGLFSKHGVPGVWRNMSVVLSEINRVLKESGNLIITIKSKYFAEFKEESVKGNFSVEVLDEAIDTVSDYDTKEKRMLLKLSKNPSNTHA